MIIIAVHIFVTSESNYQICVEKGLVAIPEVEGKKALVFDALLSRLAAIKENDFILMYIIGTKQLRGVWQAAGEAFYDETPVWPDRIYPFRCKIKCTKYNFVRALKLDDINDLRASGKIWTWELERPGQRASNSVFSISTYEYHILLTEYMKMNPFVSQTSVIPNPYPYHKANIENHIHWYKGFPQYESSVMTLMNMAFSKGRFENIFGNYSDFLCYVPTNLRTEIDLLLMYENPLDSSQAISYDIIEVKRDKFDENALKQLIGYESWFLQKKVSGDLNMVRTTAIAKSFSAEVVDYVKRRCEYENKPIKLLRYSCSEDGVLYLNYEDETLERLISLT